jgi:GT2 family glycosyltransferase
MYAEELHSLPDIGGSRQPRLTVSIATYNGRNLLEIVLPSLARQTFRDFRVAVVDDASADDTVAWVTTHWPEVEVITHPYNRGVTATLNSCLHARKSEFVALLNNDVELEPNCLAELVRALDAHPGAAVAAAKLIDFRDRALLDGAGDTYEWTGLASRRGQGTPDQGQYDTPSEIFGACGCVALYRGSALETVGDFDEQLFAFYEDVDWSFRAWLVGLTCRYVPTAVAYHMGSETLSREPSEFTLFHYWRNAIWVVAKNYPASALVRYGYKFVNSQLGNLLWALKTGRGRVFVRAWGDALRGMPTILRKRTVVQRSRTIGLRELKKVIGSDA